MSVNVNTLVRAIEDSSKQSKSPMEILEYAKAIEQLNLGSVITVPFFNDLPDSLTAIPGTLVYVVTDKRLYYYNEYYKQWESLMPVSSIGAWAWGSNASGQLGTGDSTLSTRTSPALVIGRFTDWCDVSAGDSHTAAIRTNGTLWTWGRNGQGRLGDNTVVSKSSPVSVVGGFTDWCDVSAGIEHTAAIRTNGTLWTWGFNGGGQLGDNTTVDKSSPVSVVGGFTDWSQVSAGETHTSAIRTNGTLWTWGGNNVGQLGDNTTVDKSSPVSVVGGFTDWCQVSAGRTHTAAIRTNGTLWTWGCNSQGQLGTGTTVSRSSPVSVVGGFTDWCQVSATLHTAAVRTNGTLWTWGSNTSGRLGDNTTVDKSSPVSVVGGFTDWCQVSAGTSHTAAIRTNGTLWTWGSNSSGRLGHDTAITCSRSSPVTVVGDLTGWWQVSAGGSHTAAINIVPS